MKFTYDFAVVEDKVPMIEFLERLTIRERAKVFAYIEKLVELRNNRMAPKESMSKHLEDGIFELRVSFETRIARSLYFYEADKKLIFTHGFVKKTQKTPKNEIVKAKSIRTLWRGEE